MDDIPLRETPRFITLESTATTSGKASWAIWMRDLGTKRYNTLVARVYSAEWADQITKLLNYTSMLEDIDG